MTLTWLWQVIPTAVLGFVACLWVAITIDAAIGALRIPALRDAAPLADELCPTVSILFAARDEAEKLPGALATFLALDYPRYEVVAVNDRSLDATGTVLEAVAQNDLRLKVVQVRSLPPGWLGKPHALQQAYENSTGEWLVLTDADVHFAPDVLRRAIALAEKNQWVHMPLMGEAKMYTFGERVVMTFFGLGFALATRPWSVSDPRSAAYSGVGAFQLIRRSTYEELGTHRRLALEVIDDMKLGKLVKEAGCRSGVAKAGNRVSVHWHSGVGNIIRGTTKNFFAATGFRIWMAGLQVSAILVMCVFPWVALPFAHGWALAFAVAAVAVPVVAQAGVAREFGVPVLYALTHPAGALIFAWMLVRSTIVTLWNGGITWRGTFYRIDELKRGIV